MKNFFFFLVLVVAPFSPLWSEVTNSDRLFKKATDFVKEKKYSEAVSIFEQLAGNNEHDAQYNLAFLISSGKGITKNYEEALDLVKTNQYGNGTAIFTRDGDTARDFAEKVNVGMVGVNVPIPVPLAYHTFGGWKKSAFGDLNQHGPDAFRFYTKTKTVTSRWPTGIKEGASFSIPTME